MASATLLLPLVYRYAGQALPPALAKALARADRESGEAGERAQLRRHFQIIPDHWPVAALTRQLDAGDASHASWLRADPAHVAPDMGGARMLSHGDALALTAEDVAQLLPALRPLFGDAGFSLDAPHPSRWYLRLPREAKIPAFSDPGDALGEDIFEHLDTSPEGRRWRTLANEVQVTLHTQPWNAARAARGQSPVNALWFWGGGTLPPVAQGADAEAGTHGFSDDDTARALAAASGRGTALPPRVVADAGVNDIEGTRDLQWIEREWLQPALAALRSGAIATLALDDGDGWRLQLRRWHALRAWRRGVGWPGA